MEIRNRNLTSIGLLSVVAGALFVWGFFFLMGSAPWGGRMNVVVLAEDGGGLKRGDRVQLHGVQVGNVSKVGLEPQGGVYVTLQLDNKLRLPADTRAAVKGDVFGAHVVELVPGQALVAVQSGDTIRGAAVPGLTSLVSDVGGQAKSLLTTADSILSPKTVQDLHATAAVLPISAEELLGAFVEMRSAAASVRRSAEGIEEHQTGLALASAIEQLEVGARSLSGAANAMERSFGSLASILARVEQGDGTLGRLVNDTSVYQELHDALTEFRSLAADVRAQPQQFLQLRIF